MHYCKRCVMPDTRPGIKFNKEGICQACINFEKRKSIDWSIRFKEFENLCNKYRGKYGDGYDCIIAVSGGKDSHYQVHVMKEQMKMHPLLVSVEDNFPMTEAGIHNIRNISEEFGCDIISLKPNIKAQKRVMRKTFEKYGKPTWYIDRLIYTYPIHIAIKFKLSFVVYGENINYEYGGNQNDETYSARDQIYNDVASDIPWQEVIDDVVTKKDLCLLSAPTKEEMDVVNLEPIYLSYFVAWNSYKHYVFAKKRGFRDLTHEWKRTHHIENYDQIDSRAYLVHPWMKYPKFGHATATDISSRLVRYGLITREEALRLVKEHDYCLDDKAMRDFCQFLGYRESDFWSIVERFYNPELFKKNQFGEWKLHFDAV